MSSIINFFDKDITMYYHDINNNCAVNKSIKSGRIWEKKLINIYQQFVNKESIVLDIGSNLGSHTVPLSLLCKEVYSFEAQKKIYQLLSKTIKHNNISNVNLFNVIVTRDGWKEAEFSNSEDGRASLTCLRPNLKGYTTLEKCMSIDSIHFDRLDFIKIDVEKSEWLVLDGSVETIKRHRPVIILETYKTKTNMLRLVNFCNEYNYQFRYISGDNYLLQQKKI
jgi:FkbM family methyltransferase